MYGADEGSPPVRPSKHSSREVYVGDDLPAKASSEKKKAKDPSPSTTMPTIITSKPVRPVLTANSRSSSITGDDVEAAFDAAFDEPSREHAMLPSPNVLFGLSTIQESLDPDEKRSHFHIRQSTTDDEMDLDNYFNKSTPTLQDLKSSLHAHEQSRLTLDRSSEILTPSVSLTTRVESTSLALSDAQPTENLTDDLDESVDEDVEELLGKLEVSVWRRIHAHIHTTHRCRSVCRLKLPFPFSDHHHRLLLLALVVVYVHVRMYSPRRRIFFPCEAQRSFPLAHV
jgi:hypothetical protein